MSRALEKHSPAEHTWIVVGDGTALERISCVFSKSAPAFFISPKQKTHHPASYVPLPQSTTVLHTTSTRGATRRNTIYPKHGTSERSEKRKRRRLRWRGISQQSHNPIIIIIICSSPVLALAWQASSSSLSSVNELLKKKLKNNQTCHSMVFVLGRWGLARLRRE